MDAGDDLPDYALQLMLGSMFFIVLCDFVKTVAGCWRVYCAKNAEGVSVAKVLLNIAASVYGIAAVCIGITSATAISAAWLAPVAQTAFGVLCNAALFCVLAWYVQPSNPMYAAKPDETRARPMYDARIYITGLVLQFTLFILCLSAGVAIYIFGPLIYLGAERAVPQVSVLPPLSTLFGIVAVMLSFAASCAQVFTTVTTQRPETQHWLYAVVPAVAPLCLAAIQFQTDVSWPIWFASLVPFVPEMANVLILFFRMRHNIRDMFMMDVQPQPPMDAATRVDSDESLVELGDIGLPTEQ